MEKRLRIFSVILMIFVSLIGCTKNEIPVPQFPPDAAAVMNALEKADLAWTIAEEQTWTEGHMVYTLHNEEGKIIANVSTFGDSKERVLIIGFMPSDYNDYDVMISLPDDKWEHAIKFAAILFGTFESEDVLYDEFNNNSDENNIVTQNEGQSGQQTTYEELFEWNDKINDTDCKIRTGRLRKQQSELELLSIELRSPGTDS